MRYERELKRAIEHFWKTRQKQRERQESESNAKDVGNRSAVTGGAQLEGFIELVAAIVTETGLPAQSVHTKEAVLPGYFRPTKNWDVVVVHGGHLIASIELKSHVGPSFGNNFNNRVEEAVGSASDIWTAYREGAFAGSWRPWLGWMMILEDVHNSRSPVRVSEPHFAVFDEFRHASYAERYQMFCQRLVRERLYDATCLLLSDREKGLRGEYSQASAEINFQAFASSLLGRVSAYAKKD